MSVAARSRGAATLAGLRSLLKRSWGAGAYTRVLGQELELVAPGDPLTLATGKTLQVRAVEYVAPATSPGLPDHDEFTSTLVFTID